jgi:hypothetical protein
MLTGDMKKIAMRRQSSPHIEKLTPLLVSLRLE